jgi:hypothetical protein
MPNYNPEADEIDPEDLEASAELYDRIATQHTPGPWKAHPSGRSVYTDIDNPAGLYSICQGFANNPEAMDRANMQLIALTPDLVHALEEATRILKTEVTWLYRSKKILDRFDQLIAKAKG